MPCIAFFIASAGMATNDNHERLPRAFARAGWEVECFEHESVAVASNRLVARAGTGEARPLGGFDRYWMLGFGARATFLDRMQLLRSLDQTCFVNTVDAFVYQHGKASLLLACPDVPQPITYMSDNAEALFDVVRQGGDWIAKPPAGSFGRSVYRLRADDANATVALEHLTGEGYALLQEYVAADAGCEKRALIVAGRVVGAYGKGPADHRGNLGAGAVALPTTLSDHEREILECLAASLGPLGVGFAAVDLAAGRVFEINFVNPGWLATHESICGVDLAADVVSLLA